MSGEKILDFYRKQDLVIMYTSVEEFALEVGGNSEKCLKYLKGKLKDPSLIEPAKDSITSLINNIQVYNTKVLKICSSMTRVLNDCNAFINACEGTFNDLTKIIRDVAKVIKEN